MLVDDLLPVYDVSDGVAVLVKADARTAWSALMEVDLIEVGRRRPLVGVLGALRALPEIVSHVLHGETPPKPPKRMRLRDMPEIPAGEGGWILLGEIPEQEIVLGLVGKFWRPVIEFKQVSAEEFRDFREAGYAKTIYALSVRSLSEGALLSGVMRTATTDDRARRWFMRYWTFGVGSGAHILVHGLLDAAREDAERQAEV